jgi:hypothetical protein
MTHLHILLDDKLKALDKERRWKEYNAHCNLMFKNTLLEKANLTKLRLLIKAELLEETMNTCAICLNKYKFCIIS